MARIRTIKPEFWDSPSTAKASPWARLLFIALWNWADDHGRGTANLKELEGFAFPNDDEFTDSSGNTVHFRELVAEVSACFGVVFYKVGNRPYFEIPSWDSHQRNERRSKASKHPSPQVRTDVAEMPCKNTETPNISGAGTGEQGNRGTEEQGNNSCSPATPSSVVEASNRFDEFWKAYPRKVGKQKAIAKYKAAIKRAESEQQIIDGAQRLRDDPNREDQYTPHPTTWLERNGWEDPELPQRATTGSEARLQKAAVWIGYDQAPPPEPDWSYGEFQSGAFLGEIEG